MKLSIITLTHNKLSYTKKFVESLFLYTDDFELIIVDNASTDGTREFISKIPNVKLILNEDNLGYSKGNNQGLSIAEGEYIAFFNNDILLYPNWFENVEKVFQQENVGFISPRHINPHYDNTNERHYIKFFRKNFSYKKDYEKNFDECVFSCVVTKRSVIDNIGDFDENFTPAFFEDNDLKYRAIEAGYGVYVANNVCFFHFGSITSANNDYNLKKNREYYFSKYPFAEYLTASAEERDIYKFIAYDMKKFPLNYIYTVILIWKKIKRRIKRLTKG